HESPRSSAAETQMSWFPVTSAFREGKSANSAWQRSKSSPAPMSPARISRSGGRSRKSVTIFRVAASPVSRIPQCRSAVMAMERWRGVGLILFTLSPSYLVTLSGFAADFHAEVEVENGVAAFADGCDAGDLAGADV